MGMEMTIISAVKFYATESAFIRAQKYSKTYTVDFLSKNVKVRI
jgi:hypothetical protein